jgi:predicted ATPase
MAVQKGQASLPKQSEGITRLTVRGFKSIHQEQSIEIRPLTILAGANSSGKSSIMQPLLLLKQTLEATYDPGALLLNGPNVRFTLVDQLLSRLSGGKSVDSFSVGVEVRDQTSVASTFKKSEKKGFDVSETIYQSDEGRYRLYEGMPHNEMQGILLAMLGFGHNRGLIPNITFMRNRFFLNLSVSSVPFNESSTAITVNIPIFGESIVSNYVRQMIHLPGLRGNPQRTYPITAVSSEFPGTFENYVASVVGQWQSENKQEKLEKVNRDLIRLGLAGKVVARAIDDTQVELQVNRLPRSGNEDMVSIADVGLGVSQTLPVVVALHAAGDGQLVYLEQPEIHLHPRAQVAMAEVLADAAVQGKRLVVETHSSLLLRGVQTLVAEGKLAPELVKLHWFTLREDGSTEIASADLDETGAFGEWPEDFDTVTLDAESRYLDAAEARLRGK